MRQKFQDFGWYALEVDGHDVDAIYDAIALAKHQQEKPTMIVLQTQKGKGCFFAEGIKYNHHMRFSKEQCEEAIAGVLKCRTGSVRRLKQRSRPCGMCTAKR
jgi:transketolase